MINILFQFKCQNWAKFSFKKNISCNFSKSVSKCEPKNLLFVNNWRYSKFHKYFTTFSWKIAKKIKFENSQNILDLSKILNKNIETSPNKSYYKETDKKTPHQPTDIRYYFLMNQFKRNTYRKTGGNCLEFLLKFVFSSFFKTFNSYLTFF